MQDEVLPLLGDLEKLVSTFLLSRTDLQMDKSEDTQKKLLKLKIQAFAHLKRYMTIYLRNS
jgi:hypothetical protein